MYKFIAVMLLSVVLFATALATKPYLLAAATAHPHAFWFGVVLYFGCSLVVAGVAATVDLKVEVK